MNGWNLDHGEFEVVKLEFYAQLVPWILVTLSTSSKCTVARSSASALALPQLEQTFKLSNWTGVAFQQSSFPNFPKNQVLRKLGQSIHPSTLPFISLLLSRYHVQFASASPEPLTNAAQNLDRHLLKLIEKSCAMLCLLLPWLSCSLAFHRLNRRSTGVNR